jgi:hypothetical protein
MNSSIYGAFEALQCVALDCATWHCAEMGGWLKTALGYDGILLIPIMVAASLGGWYAHRRDGEGSLLSWVTVSVVAGVVAGWIFTPCGPSSAALVGLTGSGACFAIYVSEPMKKRRGRHHDGDNTKTSS